MTLRERIRKEFSEMINAAEQKLMYNESEILNYADCDAEGDAGQTAFVASERAHYSAQIMALEAVCEALICAELLAYEKLDTPVIPGAEAAR